MDIKSFCANLFYREPCGGKRTAHLGLSVGERSSNHKNIVHSLVVGERDHMFVVVVIVGVQSVFKGIPHLFCGLAGILVSGVVPTLIAVFSKYADKFVAHREHLLNQVAVALRHTLGN